MEDGTRAGRMDATLRTYGKADGESLFAPPVEVGE